MVPVDGERLLNELPSEAVQSPSLGTFISRVSSYPTSVKTPTSPHPLAPTFTPHPTPSPLFLFFPFLFSLAAHTPENDSNGQIIGRGSSSEEEESGTDEESLHVLFSIRMRYLKKSGVLSCLSVCDVFYCNGLQFC